MLHNCHTVTFETISFYFKRQREKGGGTARDETHTFTSVGLDLMSASVELP